MTPQWADGRSVLTLAGFDKVVARAGRDVTLERAPRLRPIAVGVEHLHISS